MPVRTFIIACFAVTILATAPAHAQKTFIVDAHRSVMAYEMDHPAHHWKGTSRAAKGHVLFDEEMNPTDIIIRVPVLSFDTGNRSRDSHTAETLESYIFPEATFHASKIIVESRDSTGTETWQIEGQLAFHGVTRPLITRARVNLHPGILEAEGSFETTLTSFDIRLPSLMLVKVKDWLKVEYHFVAAAVSSASSTAQPGSTDFR